MSVSNFSVIDRPLLESVQFEKVPVEGDVADEVEGLAGVTTSRSRKNRVAAALKPSSGSRYSMGIMSLKRKKKCSFCLVVLPNTDLSKFT
jgi:hypothetical protein